MAVQVASPTKPDQRVEVDANGSLHVILYDGNNNPAFVANPSDAMASGYSLMVDAFPMGFNGTTWDRVYNNTLGTLLASAARTATTDSPDNTNFNARGVIVTLNVTVASGTGGLTVKIQGKDPISGTYYTMNAAPTAIIATGISALVLYPGASGVASDIKQVTQLALPRTWRVEIAHGDGSSYTYSLGYSLIN